jgi:small subunit ribosomal protein S9
MANIRAPKKILIVGKRKTAIARIFLNSGSGKILVNEKDFPEYFGREALRFIVQQPFDVTGTAGQYDVEAKIMGGGPAGQADALKYAIAKGLLKSNTEFRKPLKVAGLLTRDSRIVERKKYGRRGARKRSQYSKR